VVEALQHGSNERAAVERGGAHADKRRLLHWIVDCGLWIVDCGLWIVVLGDV
jgi:hypothetical protein